MVLDAGNMVLPNCGILSFHMASTIIKNGFLYATFSIRAKKETFRAKLIFLRGYRDKISIILWGEESTYIEKGMKYEEHKIISI